MLDLEAIASQYENATREFLNTVQELSDADLDVSSSGGWTARQVIHHVADSEAQSYARLRRLIAEPGTQIQGYDEGGWGENETLGYKDLPVGPSIDVFRAVRASSHELIKRLTTSQLDNVGIHTESGEYTIKNWLETYIKHPLEHAEQIRLSL